MSLSVYASTVCAYVCSVMCFHNSLSESAYLRVPTFKTQQLHQSSLLSPLISHHPTSCSLALRLHLSFQPSLLSVSFSSSLVSLFFLFFSSPHTFTSIPSPPSSLSGSDLHFPLVMGQSSTLLFLLLLLVSCILRLSRHPAKTLLSPPPHPTMKSPFISLLSLFSSAILRSSVSTLSCEFSHLKKNILTYVCTVTILI